MAASGATNANSVGAHRADTQTLVSSIPCSTRRGWRAADSGELCLRFGNSILWPTSDSYSKKNVSAGSRFAEPADSECEAPCVPQESSGDAHPTAATVSSEPLYPSGAAKPASSPVRARYFQLVLEIIGKWRYESPSSSPRLLMMHPCTDTQSGTGGGEHATGSISGGEHPTGSMQCFDSGVEKQLRKALASHCVICTESIIRFDTQHAVTGDGAVILDIEACNIHRYCRLCRMWLNGIYDWMEHRDNQKKHKSNVRHHRTLCLECIHNKRYKSVSCDKPKVSIKGKSTCESFPCAGDIHPYIAEAVVTAASQAMNVVADFGRGVPDDKKQLLGDNRLAQRVRKTKGRPSSTLSLCGGACRPIAEDTTQSVGPQQRDCIKCGVSAKFAKLRKCSGCYVARYCSRECQFAHWSAHRNDCQNLTVPLDRSIEASSCAECEDSEWMLAR